MAFLREVQACLYLILRYLRRDREAQRPENAQQACSWPTQRKIAKVLMPPPQPVVSRPQNILTTPSDLMINKRVRKREVDQIIRCGRNIGVYSWSSLTPCMLGMKMARPRRDTSLDGNGPSNKGQWRTALACRYATLGVGWLDWTR